MKAKIYSRLLISVYKLRMLSHNIQTGGVLLYVDRQSERDRSKPSYGTTGKQKTRIRKTCQTRSVRPAQVYLW